MLMIQLPRLVRRNFRPLSEHEYFKAHEWKHILLFVAIPLLKDLLPERYVNEFIVVHYQYKICFDYH